MKTCFKCGLEKDLSMFYAHPRMRDGHLNKCSDCTKRDSKARTDGLKSDPNWVAKERARCREKTAKSRRLGRVWKTDPARVKEWQKRNPNKRRAHNLAALAVKRGVLKNPGRCEGCGAETRLAKHHPDYSQPLFVQWLCSACHGIAHRKAA